MARYRKKPIVVEAMRLTGANMTEVCDWINDSPDAWRGGNYDGNAYPDMGGINVPTLEGNMFGRWGCWIIKGVEGEFYPCAPDIFEATYEEVPE